MYKRLQEYNTSLQQYNGKLHTDLSTVEDELKRIEKDKATMVESLSMLRGQLTMSRVSLFYFYLFCMDCDFNVRTCKKT